MDDNYVVGNYINKIRDGKTDYRYFISVVKWQNSRDLCTEDYRLIHTGAEENESKIAGESIILNKEMGRIIKGYVQ